MDKHTENLLKKCQDAADTFPVEHLEYAKIMIQIEQIKSGDKKSFRR
jgi:hypothetical protein